MDENNKAMTIPILMSSFFVCELIRGSTYLCNRIFYPPRKIIVKLFLSIIWKAVMVFVSISDTSIVYMQENRFRFLYGQMFCFIMTTNHQWHPTLPWITSAFTIKNIQNFFQMSCSSGCKHVWIIMTVMMGGGKKITNMGVSDCLTNHVERVESHCTRK